MVAIVEGASHTRFVESGSFMLGGFVSSGDTILSVVYARFTVDATAKGAYTSIGESDSF